MDVRPATEADSETIRAIADASMAASYGHAIDDARLANAVESWYSPDRIAEATEDPAIVLLVADIDGEPAGFSKGVVVDRRLSTGEIHWLHVHPDHRGQGIGSELLEHTERALREEGVEQFAGFVIAVNERGAEFYERHGYDLESTYEIDVGGEQFIERKYVRNYGETGGRGGGLEPVTVDGVARYVAYDESERGSTGSFYPVYDTREREDRYSWYCGNCESANVAMDTMGRVECSDCNNRRKPTRWDAAYL